MNANGKLWQPGEKPVYLESKNADIQLEQGESVEYWWISNGCITVMSYCPHNDSPGVVHQMDEEMAIEQLIQMYEEGWYIGKWGDGATQLMLKHSTLAVCESCGHWAKADEDGDCILCAEAFCLSDGQAEA